VVNALGLVEAQVGLELSLRAAVAGMDLASEGGAPALIEDCLVHSLDVSVGLRPNGVDGEVTDTELPHCAGEVAAAKLGRRVARD
jgi:hypothetical protein